ncbi:Hypothetical_protein [Hexamita inflata]|uniref:Hypothetical_protein n=1 Tax=Hexamita inflata TaxID=28002 RepID=A0AA86NV54_9EUKA|nr:Hypothetical protein HINF_LOCUS14817 [Hexamita inflata]
MQCIVKFNKLFRQQTLQATYSRINNLIIVTLPDEHLYLDINQCQEESNGNTTTITNKKQRTTIIITNSYADYIKPHIVYKKDNINVQNLFSSPTSQVIYQQYPQYSPQGSSNESLNEDEL